MKAWMPIFGCALLLAGGCAKQVRIPTDPFTFNHYVADNFDWPSVKRVLVMPLDSPQVPPSVAEDLRSALIAELQRDGRFEIVAAPPDMSHSKSAQVFASGQFDEVELLYLARRFQVQGVLFGRVTQYHAYTPPRVGMSLMLASPSQAVVIASLDGMWDGREQGTVDKAKAYYQKTLSWPQSLLGADRVLQSPDVFRRFVCHDAAHALRQLVDEREGKNSHGQHGFGPGGPGHGGPGRGGLGPGGPGPGGRGVPQDFLPPGAVVVPNGAFPEGTPGAGGFPVDPRTMESIPPPSGDGRRAWGGAQKKPAYMPPTNDRGMKSLDFSPPVQPFRPVPTPPNGKIPWPESTPQQGPLAAPMATPPVAPSSEGREIGFQTPLLPPEARP